MLQDENAHPNSQLNQWQFSQLQTSSNSDMKNNFDDGEQKQIYNYTDQIKKKVRAYGTPEKSMSTSSMVSRKKKGDQEMLEVVPKSQEEHDNTSSNEIVQKEISLKSIQ